MRLMRSVARLAVLIGLLVLSRSAWAGAGADDSIEAKVKVLADLSKPDEKRIKARDSLLQAGAKGLDALVELGQNPGNGKEEDKDNVRMHVAIALANVRPDHPTRDVIDAVRKKTAENLELLTSWIDRKDADPALRYWAIRAVSFAQAPDSGNVLKKVLDARPDLSVRMSIARSLGIWEGAPLANVAVPMLAAMVKDKEPSVRVAGIEGLRSTKRDKKDVMLPLFAIVEDDPDEAAWRAAAEAIHEIAVPKMDFYNFINGRPSAKERKEFFDQRELDWKRTHKEEEEEAK